PLETDVAAGLIGQLIVRGKAVAAERAVEAAMDCDAEIVSVRLLARGGIGGRELRSHCRVAGRARAKERCDAIRKPLELAIGNREAADVAGSVGERHPRGRRRLAKLV